MVEELKYAQIRAFGGEEEPTMDVDPAEDEDEDLEDVDDEDDEEDETEEDEDTVV